MRPLATARTSASNPAVVIWRQDAAAVAVRAVPLDVARGLEPVEDGGGGGRRGADPVGEGADVDGAGRRERGEGAVVGDVDAEEAHQLPLHLVGQADEGLERVRHGVELLRRAVLRLWCHASKVPLDGLIIKSF